MHCNNARLTNDTSHNAKMNRYARRSFYNVIKYWSCPMKPVPEDSSNKVAFWASGAFNLNVNNDDNLLEGAYESSRPLL